MTTMLCDGFVLHRRPYRETSFLVDILTREWGRLRVIARGQRNRKNGGSQLLQPFRALQFSVTGRNELKHLRSVEGAQLGYVLKGKALFCALYLNELLARLLQNELPVPELFDAYQQSLMALSQPDNPFEPVLRSYELMLLEELGYAPDFAEHSQGPIQPGDWYCYDDTQGFVPVASQDAARTTFAGKDLLAIGEGRWHQDALRTAKRLNRLALHPLLGNKPLKSRELFMTMEL